MYHMMEKYYNQATVGIQKSHTQIALLILVEVAQRKRAGLITRRTLDRYAQPLLDRHLHLTEIRNQSLLDIFALEC
jgi:hypothetical protein